MSTIISKLKTFYLSQILGIVLSFILIGIPYYIHSSSLIKDELFKSIQKMSFFGGIYLNAILFFVILVVGILIHELIHALFFVIFSKKGRKSIKIGVQKDFLMPYCHCNEPLPINHYIVALVAPCLILGIIPYVIGVFNLNLFLLGFGFIFTVLSIGDLLILYYILKDYRPNSFFKDSETEVGGEYID